MEKVTSSATLKLWLFFCLHYSVFSSLLPSPILLWVSEGEETETHIYEHGNKQTHLGSHCLVQMLVLVMQVNQDIK